MKIEVRVIGARGWTVLGRRAGALRLPVGRLPISVGRGVVASESPCRRRGPIRQRLADPQSLQAIAGLFPPARSLEAQRAIACILIRSDYRVLARADLARTLSQHRLKSPTGSDVIDVLIRLLRSA